MWVLGGCQSTELLQHHRVCWPVAMIHELNAIFQSTLHKAFELLNFLLRCFFLDSWLSKTYPTLSVVSRKVSRHRARSQHHSTSFEFSWSKWHAYFHRPPSCILQTNTRHSQLDQKVSSTRTPQILLLYLLKHLLVHHCPPNIKNPWSILRAMPKAACTVSLREGHPVQWIWGRKFKTPKPWMLYYVLNRNK